MLLKISLKGESSGHVSFHDRDWISQSSPRSSDALSLVSFFFSTLSPSRRGQLVYQQSIYSHAYILECMYVVRFICLRKKKKKNVNACTDCCFLCYSPSGLLSLPFLDLYCVLSWPPRCLVTSSSSFYIFFSFLLSSVAHISKYTRANTEYHCCCCCCCCYFSSHMEPKNSPLVFIHLYADCWSVKNPIYWRRI